MSFSDILKKRIELHGKGDGKGIYALYSDNSQFKEFFPTEESYCSHFEKIALEQVPAHVEVFRETNDDSTGEALYIEVFMRGDTPIKYYSKTLFVKENGAWKILQEKREEQSIKD